MATVSPQGPRLVVAKTRSAHAAEKPAPHLRWVLLAFGGYSIFLTAFTLTGPVDGYAFTTITDLVGLIAPFAAAGLALYAATRSADELHAGWLLIGLGSLLWGIGEGAWVYYEVIARREAPFPSAADVGYLGMIPLVTLGVISFASDGQRVANSRPTLDGLALVLAFAAAVWYLVLRPTYSESDAGALDKAIAGAYPIGDIVIAYALMVAVRRQWQPRARVVLLTLLAGVLMLIAADVGFASLTLNDGYSANSIVNLGWPIGFLLIGYAAALGAAWRPAFLHEADAVGTPDWAQAMPVLLIPMMGFLDMVAWRDQGWGTATPMLVMTGLSTAAILLRQSIHLGLLDQFEGRRASLLSWLDDELRAA